MNLISFSDQLHEFLKTQQRPQNPPLGKAIAKAEQIIAESTVEQMSQGQSLQAMHKVSACFKEFPEIHEGVQKIIQNETEKIGLVGERVLLKMQPTEGEERTSLVEKKEAQAREYISKGMFEEAFKVRTEIAHIAFPLDHPLGYMEQAIEKGSEGKPLSRMGAYFQGLDTGSVKMGTIHASKREIVNCASDESEVPQECFCFDFNLTHIARQELEKTIQAIQAHPEALQKISGCKIHIHPESKPVIPAYIEDREVYALDRGWRPKIGGKRIEIEVEGAGKIFINTDLFPHSLYRRVEIILDARRNVGPNGLQNLHTILALFGLGTTLFSSRPEDEKRMKIFILLHAYFPTLSYKLERDPGNYSISVEQLRQKICSLEPNADVVLKKYLESNPELLVKEELYSGRDTYMIKDMGESVQKHACGLLFGMAANKCESLGWSYSPRRARERFREIAAECVQKLEAGVTQVSNSENWSSRGYISGGSTPGQDLAAGGFDSVFTRLFPKSYMGKKDLKDVPFCHDGIRVLVDSDAMGYASCYAHSEDRFGARVDTSYGELTLGGLSYSKRPGLPEFARQVEETGSDEMEGRKAYIGSNEVMIRDLIPTKFMRALLVKRQEMKDVLVEEFRKAGMIQELEGRECVVLPGCIKPVDEFFYVGNVCQEEMWAKLR